jgi:hypothetical protein
MSQVVSTVFDCYSKTLLKREQMNNTKTLLNKDLHLRVDENFQSLLIQIANQNNLKPSTFARIVLQRTVPSYSRNRFLDVV